VVDPGFIRGGPPAAAFPLAPARYPRLGARLVGALLGAIAQHPDALELLGKVDQRKVGAERFQQVVDLRNRQPGDDLLKRRHLLGLIAVAQLFRQAAHLLFKREGCFAGLLANDVAQDVAQEVDRGREPVALAAGLLKNCRHAAHLFYTAAYAARAIAGEVWRPKAPPHLPNGRRDAFGAPTLH
jgi:hypothetical protein